ncbi:hypothetical protein [Pelagibaculum spongiae]|uniref:Uncharacterized protein n=1 Tax=Pelagibaculum spongiae TaxID=2080658 RepID=A0A2V1GQE4_9GAMM|nr:hypothetical protein [Pelagibaculum spongiae]PVZ63576.1 hypothetical protein DC094_21075 [Pelagibaculum spongiae]
MPTFQEQLAQRALDHVILETKVSGVVNLLHYTPYSEDGFKQALARKMEQKRNYVSHSTAHTLQHGSCFTSIEVFEDLLSIIKAFGGADCIGLSYLALKYIRENGGASPRLVFFYIEGEFIAHCCVLFNGNLSFDIKKFNEVDIFKLDDDIIKNLILVDPWLNFHSSLEEYFSKLNDCFEGKLLFSLSESEAVKITDFLKKYERIVVVNPYNIPAAVTVDVDDFSWLLTF